MFKEAVLELQYPEGAVLFNLSAFGSGATNVLDRIPDNQSGIYAWFRTFNFRENPSEFADDIIDAIRLPKFQGRKGDIAPYYEVSLRSKSTISANKEKSLRLAMEDADFAQTLRLTLSWAMLFQAPLYIGKSAHLRARIKQHLSSGSILRERLKDAGIEIDHTYLLLLPTGESPDNVNEHESADDGLIHSRELLFEEIFSRLFNPGFTIRLG